jgi:hypothetical protein
MQVQIDNKNRCFKDFYNKVEDSIFKLHEIFLAYHTQKNKIDKYEVTF